MAVVAVRPVARGGDFVLHMPLTLHNRHAGVGLNKAMLSPVRLFDRDLKIAAVGGGVQIGYFKRTGRHVLLINQIAVLAHGDFGV